MTRSAFWPARSHRPWSEGVAPCHKSRQALGDDWRRLRMRKTSLDQDRIEAFARNSRAIIGLQVIDVWIVRLDRDGTVEPNTLQSRQEPVDVYHAGGAGQPSL